ncbi:hypothetical protein GH865_13175 [Rhodocyclus tenuis]|nr:hypothetical protein [Rhodocyclus gracilis]
MAQSERQSIEHSRNEMVKAMEARLADAQEQQRELAAQAKDAREALERATEHLRIAQASRAEEATKAAERIGKLEGELTSLEKQWARPQSQFSRQDVENDQD